MCNVITRSENVHSRHVEVNKLFQLNFKLALKGHTVWVCLVFTAAKMILNNENAFFFSRKKRNSQKAHKRLAYKMFKWFNLIKLKAF